MLSEIRNARQVAGEGYRRWFTDDDFDLIVWYADGGDLVGFQLCYGKEESERALTWTRAHGFQHNRVDTGEVAGRSKMTPLIIADGTFDADPVVATFRRQCAGLEPALSSFVIQKLGEYPQ
jgi:hypothetical protein